MTDKLNPNIVRQGDVVLVRVERLGFRACEAQRDDHGRYVIEHGEASGHAHAIHDPNATCFRAETAEMAALAGLHAVFVGGGGATLRHEYIDGRFAEHAEIALAPGDWERPVQVEFRGAQIAD